MKRARDTEPEEDALSEALRSALLPRMDPFTEKRIRAAVLRVPQPSATRRGSGRLWMLGASLAVAVSVAGLVVLRRVPREPPSSEMTPLGTSSAEVAAVGSHVVVIASEDAAYHREIDGETSRVVVSRGQLDVEVGEHTPAERLIVMVPDGEIEDVGTVFRVVVRSGRTEQIVVSEGAVVFRRTGHPALTVAAGESYRAPATSVTPSSIAPRPVPNEMAAAPSATVRAAARAPAAPSKAPSPAASGAAPTTSATPGTDAAEDVVYMRIVTLMREGRNEDARSAAQSYLARFPNGFRRVEVARIAK